MTFIHSLYTLTVKYQSHTNISHLYLAVYQIEEKHLRIFNVDRFFGGVGHVPWIPQGIPSIWSSILNQCVWKYTNVSIDIIYMVIKGQIIFTVYLQNVGGGMSQSDIKPKV